MIFGSFLFLFVSREVKVTLWEVLFRAGSVAEFESDSGTEVQAPVPGAVHEGVFCSVDISCTCVADHVSHMTTK